MASTYSTCYCSISAAIGALYGFLHGGANEPALTAAEEIGSPENVGPWLDRVLATKQKVMGMGHRVYKAKDPRAVIIEKHLQELSRRKDDFRLYEILKELEKQLRERQTLPDLSALKCIRRACSRPLGLGSPGAI